MLISSIFHLFHGQLLIRLRFPPRRLGTYTYMTSAVGGERGPQIANERIEGCVNCVHGTNPLARDHEGKIALVNYRWVTKS